MHNKPNNTMKRITLLANALSVAALLSGIVSKAGAQGTAFTYQGRLSDSGSLPNANYDMYFSLFGTSSGGTILGALTNKPVAVTNGLFFVTLDYGSGVFSGAPRWLEIGVRTNGSTSSYTTLLPRQQITPA